MAKGLDGAKRDAWRRRLAKFEASGWTVVEFCRREQVSQASFYYWSKRVRGRDGSTTRGLPRVGVGNEVSTRTSHGAARNEEGSGCVEVVIGDSIRVRMSAGEPTAVAALVHQLQRAQQADASATTGRFQRIELT